MARVLTATQLMDACWLQRNLFARLFGDQVVVTEELASEWHDVFDWDYGARLLFGQIQIEAYVADVKKCVSAHADRQAALGGDPGGGQQAASFLQCRKDRAAAWARSYNLGHD